MGLIANASSRLLLLDAATISGALPLSDWIAVAERSFRGASEGAAVQDIRRILPLPGDESAGRVLSLMFGAIRDPDCFGAKVLSVFPDNFNRGLDSHRGAVLLFDSDSGALKALLDGGEVTAARTAAASAVATRVLARADSKVLTILGYGEQASRHVDAIILVRPIVEVRCWGRDPAKAASFAAKIAARHPVRVIVAGNVAEAVADADIVCTTTGAKYPILRGNMLRPGLHLNVVGSSTADYREVDTAVVLRSSIWVDYRPMAEVSAGEYLQALAEGKIRQDHIIGEIGAVLSGRIQGRTDDNEITMFKSLGMPAEDIYAAQLVYEVASANGLGVQIDF